MTVSESTGEMLARFGTGATIPGQLRHWARERPDRLFLWCGEDRMTYREADERSDRVAAGLAELGVVAGERVAIISENRPEMLELYFGAAKIGAVQVPVNVFLKGQFLADLLADAAATTLIVDDAGYRAARELVSRLPGLRRIVTLDAGADLDPPPAVEVTPYARVRASSGAVPDVEVTPDTRMSIVYTSGTTGAPKGCLLTQGYYLRVGAIADAVCSLDETDVLMTAMPLFHGGARMTCTGGALCKGITAVIEPSFRSTFLKRASETGASILFGVAATGQVLLAQPPSPADRDHRVRMAVWGPADADAERRIFERFGFEVVSRVYGQTECGYSAFSSPSHPARPGSSGRAAPDLEMKIFGDDETEQPFGDVGEIVIRPHHRNALFLGYWNKPEATLQTFRGLWYHTGDYGRMDEDGSMTFVDRKKDYLRRRGENISSLQLEAAIAAHPDIAEVAVHAVPSPMSEDDIKACIVCAEGRRVEPKALFAFLVETVPYFAIPRYVEIVDELPKNALSRVQKHILRDRGITDATWDFDADLASLSREARRASP